MTGFPFLSRQAGFRATWWRHSRVRQFCLLAPVLFAITSCTQKPTDPLRVATNTWPGYQPLYLAQDLGYLKGVDLHEMPSSSPVIRAFRNRSVDIAALTLDEVLPLVQDGVHAHVILVTDFSHGGDVLLAGPSVATLQDLKGKRIGVENTALGAYMLTRALQHAGLAVNDIRIVPRTVDLHAGAFLSGDVDAVVTFEPVSTRLLKEGARILFDSSMIPGEILDVLVAHDDVLQRRPRAVDDLLEAWYRALDDMSQDPKEAFGKMARHMDAVNARDIENSMKGLTIPRRRENRQLLEGTEPQIIPVAERLMQVMLANGLLKRPVDLPSLLPGAPMKTDSP